MSLGGKEPNELYVVNAEWAGEMVDIGAAAAKAMRPQYRYRYSRPVNYTLENGVVVPCVEKAMTKPKLQAELDSTLKRIAAKQYFAKPEASMPNGYYFITRMVISLAAGG